MGAHGCRRAGAGRRRGGADLGAASGPETTRRPEPGPAPGRDRPGWLVLHARDGPYRVRLECRWTHAGLLGYSRRRAAPLRAEHRRRRCHAHRRHRGRAAAGRVTGRPMGGVLGGEDDQEGPLWRRRRRRPGVERGETSRHGVGRRGQPVVRWAGQPHLGGRGRYDDEICHDAGRGRKGARPAFGPARREGPPLHGEEEGLDVGRRAGGRADAGDGQPERRCSPTRPTHATCLPATWYSCGVARCGPSASIQNGSRCGARRQS